MFDRRDLIRMLGLAAITPLATARSRADAGRPVNTLGSSDGVAIRGYDPVAYFRDGGPRLGKVEFSVRHAGAVWRFTSAQHRALFEADPERYLPAYGGFCAYGTSRGYLVKIEPEAWTIVDGRLYLNYDLSVRKTWSAKTRVYIDRADAKWPNLTLQ